MWIKAPTIIASPLLRSTLNEIIGGSDLSPESLESLRKQANEIEIFCGHLLKSAIEKAVYNLKTNVPLGIMKLEDCNSKAAIITGAVKTLSHLIDYEQDVALGIAADLTENVNAHAETSVIRGMRTALLKEAEESAA